MTRKEIIDKLVIARVEECKKINDKKFGKNHLLRVNENPKTWEKYYKNMPMTSKKYPAFSLIGQFKCYCN